MKLFESLRGEGRTCIEWSGLAGHYQLRPYINLQLIAIQFWLWRHHMTRSPPVTLPASDGVVEVTCSRRGRGAPVLLLSSDLRAGGEPSGDWARPADTGEADGLHLTLAVTWRYKHYTSQPSGQCQPPQLLIPLWDMKADRRNDQTCLSDSPASVIRWISIILRGPAQSDVTVWFALKGRLLSYPEDPLPSEFKNIVIVLGLTNNCHYNYGVIQRTLIASWWSSVHFER